MNQITPYIISFEYGTLPSLLFDGFWTTDNPCLYRIGYYSCHNHQYMNISFDEKPMTFSLHLETLSYCGAICDVHFRTILHTVRFACIFQEISIQNIKDVFLVDRG